MSSSVMPQQGARATVAAAAAERIAFPWQLTAVVFAATSVIVGLIWDISWHMTIGRDTFWTPAHLAIYTGGAVAGLASGFEVLRRSFFGGPARDGVTVWRLFNGPLGGWLAIWGAVAMLTSAPFDDWWHAAYGLDVKIISPPHALLAAGFLFILAGALLLAVAEQARDERVADAGTRAPWVVAYTSGLVLTMLAIFTSEYHEPDMMHSGVFYATSALVFPFVLVAAGRATRLRFPATATAAVYLAVMCVQLWLLPLFEATPKLGPIRQAVSHMVPLDFPLLLIVPAFAIDLVLRATVSRGAWMRALMLGLTFLLGFAAVQWPFGEFLLSPASHNALFRSDNYPYMLPTEWIPGPGEFMEEPAGAAVRGFAIAAVLAVLSARAGLGWGNWLRAVRR